MNLTVPIAFIKKCLKAGDTMQRAYEETVRLFTQPVARAARTAVETELQGLYIPKDFPMVADPNFPFWYPGPSDNDTFWPKLKSYLANVLAWPESAISSLDQFSTRIVGRLQPPGTDTIRTRGLVVGYVQSGKTANFTAVISKSADINYRLFIILSGITNSLRNQTQLRLERELISLNPEKWLTITKGKDDFTRNYPVNPDFALNGQQWNLVVLKKNATVMRRFIAWLRSTNKDLLRQCPMLIIDDEADQASINTSRNEARRKPINALILELLKVGPRSAYVGYTATPFANVLNEAPDGSNLYPADFIVCLPRPDTYFGPERIFGRDRLTPEEDDAQVDGLDMIREVPEQEISLLQPGEAEPQVTPSLDEAIKYFWLCAAAKRVRKLPDRFTTMLIHTSMLTVTHGSYSALLQRYYQDILPRVERNDAALLAAFRDLWADESSRVTPEQLDMEYEKISFDQIRPLLPEVIRQTRIIVDNYKSPARIDFSGPDGVFIVIGGNTLSRGLTLEGLVVSYFLRSSTTYDTLMQMGRWFGYRPGYADLPRIWMTNELREYFFFLATVEEEFREEVKRYAMGLSPADFGPRIRTHPALGITSRMKMQAAVPCFVEYGDHFNQTILFRKDKTWLESNERAALDLIARAVAVPTVAVDKKAAPGRLRLFKVPVELINAFFREYAFHPDNQELTSDLIINYIAEQNRRGALDKWNIVICGHRTAPWGKWETAIGGVGYVNRSQLPPVNATKLNIKALLSKEDIVADLDGPDLKQIENLGTRGILEKRLQVAPGQPLLIVYPVYKNSRPGKTFQQSSRSPTRVPLEAPCDIIGVGIVWPKTSVQTPQQYVTVNMAGAKVEEPDYNEEEEESNSPD